MMGIEVWDLGAWVVCYILFKMACIGAFGYSTHNAAWFLAPKNRIACLERAWGRFFGCGQQIMTIRLMHTTNSIFLWDTHCINYFE